MSMAVHKAALDMFTEVGMESLVKKSHKLTTYLEFVLDEVRKNSGVELIQVTPRNPKDRGAHISVSVPGAEKSLVTRLAQDGTVVDWREPNVIRIAPVPFYNSFEDVYWLGQKLIALLR